MLEKLDNALHNDDAFFYNEDFDKVTFIANQRHILAVDLDKIDLDNNKWWNFCMSEDEKKGNRTSFLLSNAFSAQQ